MSTQRDFRPIQSPAPADVQPIGVAAQVELSAMLARVVADIIALSGNAAERENDAISVVSLLAAFAAKQLVGELMLRKNLPPAIALTIARKDIDERLVDMLDEALSGRGTLQ